VIKTAIIGLGIRGALYAQTLKYSPYAQLSAISEINEETLEDGLKKYGTADTKGYTRYEEMLDNERIDLAVVTLPDHLHKEPVILATGRKCHLFIEKPLSTSFSDAQTMAEAIKKAGVKSMVAFENRWYPSFITAKKAKDEGEIGDIQIINAFLNDTIYVPTQMLTWAAFTTPAWFLFPHLLDMALWLSGKRVISVYSKGFKKLLLNRGIDTYDSITSLIEFSDGAAGTFSSSWVYPESMPLVFDHRFEVVGTKGVIAIDLRDQMIHKMTDSYVHPFAHGRIIHGMPVGYAADMLESFIDSIRFDLDPIVEIDHALYVVSIIDAVHRSIESGSIEKVKII